MGIDQGWLNANAEKAWTELARDGRYSTPSQHELFLKTFTNAPLVSRAIANKSWHTDDYPDVSVRIDLNGIHLQLRSTSQQEFMVPWDREEAGLKTTKCNPEIGRTLAALLPEKFENLDRLRGDHLRYEVADLVATMESDEMDMVGADDLVGPEIRALGTNYKLISSRIGCTESIDLDCSTGWVGAFHRADLPGTVTLYVGLPYDQRHLVGIDLFKHRVDSYIQTANSARWLSAYLRSDANLKVELHFVKDRSFSKTALKTFTEDMKGQGQQQLIQKVEDNPEAVVFLEVEDTATHTWSRWVVLPGGDAILWEFQGNSVLGRSSAELHTWECYGWHCTGTLISAEGQIKAPI